MIVTFPVYLRLYVCYINLFLTYRFLIAAKTVSKYFGSHQNTLTQINKIIDNQNFIFGACLYYNHSYEPKGSGELKICLVCIGVLHLLCETHIIKNTTWVSVYLSKLMKSIFLCWMPSFFLHLVPRQGYDS